MTTPMRRATNVAGGLLLFAAGFGSSTVLSAASAVPDVHLQPGQQVTIYADAPLPSATASPSATAVATSSPTPAATPSPTPTAALTPTPVPEPTPAAGTVYPANSSADVIALLSRTDLPKGAVIQVKAGVKLAPLTLGPGQSGDSGGTIVDFGGDTIDLGGAACCKPGIFLVGATDLELRHFNIGNGSVDQMGAITIGNSTNPPPTRRVRITDFELLPTLTGPGKLSSTANATAHGIYISRATGAHEDIEIDHFVAHADGKGMAAFLHLYDGSGTTIIRRLHVHDGQMFGFIQTVMAWEEGAGADAGTADDAILEDLAISGSGQYALRLPYGNGIVRRTTITGTATVSKGAGWTVQP